MTDTDDQDVRSGNYGLVSVDLAAPGQNILSTIPTQACVLPNGCCVYSINYCPEPAEECTYVCTPESDPYWATGGTSMAAPHVAGVAALLRAVKPGIPALSIKARILRGVDPNIPSLVGKTVTGGRLNAYKTVYPQESGDPNAVTNLAAQNSPTGSVVLTWTAPADPAEAPEPVVFYDLRYSTSTITSANFGSATRFWDVATPLSPGSAQTTTVTGLTAYTPYYFAMKAVDDWGNDSALSNVITAQTCNMCTQSFCKPWGEDLFKRCTWAGNCGTQGCCIYTCVIDATCESSDPCPSHACADACN